MMGGDELGELFSPAVMEMSFQEMLTANLREAG